MQMLESLLGAQGARVAAWVLAALALLLLVILLWWLIQKALGGRLNMSDRPDRRGRPPRLGITESFTVDRQGRRLVMIRRDNVEHLVMIGGAERSSHRIDRGAGRASRNAARGPGGEELVPQLDLASPPKSPEPNRLPEPSRPLDPPPRAAPPERLPEPPRPAAPPAPPWPPPHRRGPNLRLRPPALHRRLRLPRHRAAAHLPNASRAGCRSARRQRRQRRRRRRRATSCASLSSVCRGAPARRSCPAAGAAPAASQRMDSFKAQLNDALKAPPAPPGALPRLPSRCASGAGFLARSAACL